MKPQHSSQAPQPTKRLTSAAASTEELWNLLADRLRSFLLLRVSNEQVAADLLQETFLRIHRNLSAVADEQRLEAWIFQIARNLVVDYYRTKDRAAVDRQADEFLELPQPEDAENFNARVATWLRSAIDALPPTYREAVRLFEIEGLSQQQIAQRLGVSLSAVKSRVRRGREKLKQSLDDCCAFQLDRRGNVLDIQRREAPCCGEPPSR